MGVSMGRSILISPGKVAMDHPCHCSAKHTDQKGVRRTYSELERRSWKTSCLSCPASSPSSALLDMEGRRRGSGEAGLNLLKGQLWSAQQAAQSASDSR